MTDNKHEVKVLNELIETTFDSANSYGEAVSEVKNPAFKTMFDMRTLKRRQLAGELQTQVRTLGGTPADDGTALAAAHRMFVNLKIALTGDDQSIVNEVERGEDHIKARYEEALKDTSLSAPVKEAIRTAYASIRADHDQISTIKHELQGRNAS